MTGALMPQNQDLNAKCVQIKQSHSYLTYNWRTDFEMVLFGEVVMKTSGQALERLSLGCVLWEHTVKIII